MPHFAIKISIVNFYNFFCFFPQGMVVSVFPVNEITKLASFNLPYSENVCGMAYKIPEANVEELLEYLDFREVSQFF